MDGQPLNGFLGRIGLGHQRDAETQLGDLLQALLATRRGTHFASQADLALMSSVVELMASYERNRQMVDMGAYKAGSNAGIDRAMQLFPAVRAVLRQSVLESSTRQDALARMRRAMGAPR